ncbi:FecR domain-containing protein [Comamonas sp. JUb58]|uniref:FecR domain-containing protein n=1 Tax=Comamonas sp. JUb58 TaxID=2485114 RepID=UPI00105F9BD0|nr:FecR domain-containing protein [Comamonas sp. JUb58]TDS85024.1 FecR family protein [Comamonas sp. JUb58]
MQAHILDEAADWLVRLHDGGLSAAEHADLERWKQTSAAHAAAWMRAQLLMDKLGGLPAEVAMPALGRRDRLAAPKRRAAVLRMAALLTVVPAGWLGWRVLAEQAGELRAEGSQQRRVLLADGSRLLLDAGARVWVAFDDQQRLLSLKQGAIFLETAPDPSGRNRPLLVATAQGRLRALGTRFSVRDIDSGRSVHLAVSQGAVEVSPRSASAPVQVVAAGSAILLDARGAGPVVPARPQAWVQGMLVADAMPLAEVCAELGRYRQGLLQCSAEVAQILVSGAYPLADTDSALAMLAQTYGVAIHRRLGGYWVTVTRDS